MNGFRLTTGYRNQITPELEGQAKISYLSLGDDSSHEDDSATDTLVTIGLEYNFFRNVSGVLEVNEDGYILGARFEF